MKNKTLNFIFIVMYFIMLSGKGIASKADITPVADFEIPEAGLCRDSVVVFKNLGHPSNYYFWKIDGTTVATTFDLTYTLSYEGTYYISLVVDSSGFTNVITKEIIVTSKYVYDNIKFSDSLICKYSEVEFTISYPDDYTKYQLWRINDNVLIDEGIKGYGSLTLFADSVQNNNSYFITIENTCIKKYTDTFNVKIKQTPKDDITFNYRDTVLCNSGTPILDIYNTELNTIYTTNRINCYNCFISDTGNGGQITLVRPEITEDKGFEFFATNITTGCKKYYSEDTIKVDTVIADFKTNKINVYANEPVLCRDLSYGNPTIQWYFDSDASITYSTDAIVENVFDTPGLKHIKLVNETEFGCMDSIEKSIFIHDTNFYNKTGWVLNGGRVDYYDGRAGFSFFSSDNLNNIFVTSEFDKTTEENVVFNSYRGYNLEAAQKRGNSITKYDAFGLARWQNTIFEPIERPKVHTIKVIQDTLVFVGFESARINVEVNSTDGNKIIIPERKAAIIYNTDGEYISHFATDKSVSMIETDNDGNIYMIFSQSDDESCFLTKYSPTMDSLWTVYFSHSYLNNQVDPNIAIDPFGNILVVGSFQSDMTVNATNGDYIIYNSRHYYSSESHYNDIHFFKLSKNGEFLWGNIAFKLIYVDVENGVDIASDSDGGVYVLCSTDRGKLYVTSNEMVVDSLDLNDFSLLKYNPNGSYAWGVGKKSGQGGIINGHRVIVDSKDNLHVLGAIYEKGEFTSTDTLTNYIIPYEKDKTHVFIAEYNKDGVFNDIWLKKQRNFIIDDLIIDSDTNFNVLFKNTPYLQEIDILNTSLTLRPEEYMLVKFNQDFCNDSISILDIQIDSVACENYLLSLKFQYFPIHPDEYNYIVELSDNEGSFLNPRMIGNLTTSDTIDTIDCYIPIDEVYGNKYRVRVVNLSTGSKSKVNENDIVFEFPGKEEVTIQYYLCGNDSILINGTYYSSPGVFVDTNTNVTSCDSITHHIIAYRTGYLHVSSCDEYLSPGGMMLYSSGTYLDTISTFEGCDSILTIDLTIYKSTISTIQAVECESYTSPSGKYIWTENGVYLDTIENSIGCDSIITIELTILKSSSSTISPTVCESYISPSGRYTWTQSGVYTDTIINASGCDSIITVDLTILETTFSEIDTMACDSYTSPNGENIWTENGTYTNTIKNSAGCDSIIVINLVMDCSGMTVDEYDKQISIYPNPTKGNFVIYFDKTYANVTITLKNLSGQIISSKTYNNILSVKLSTPDKNSVYLLEIQIDNSLLKTFRIIKI